tara:strand:+ start:693 stop:974 length:282 start_codon:yes stop_codon:yes gene_type:complete
MPANKKHLSNKGQRALKVTAAIIGGYFVTVLFLNAIGGFFLETGELLITSMYSSFFIWVALMVLAFLSKNGWKIWGIYILLSIIFYALIFIPK